MTKEQREGLRQLVPMFEGRGVYTIPVQTRDLVWLLDVVDAKEGWEHARLCEYLGLDLTGTTDDVLEMVKALADLADELRARLAPNAGS